MKTFYFFLFTILVFAACDDDEMPPVDPYTQELRINMVTGLQARDANAAPIGSYGNPNTFSGEVDVYPNPAIDQVNVIYFGGAGLTVKQYWIFPADKSTDFVDIDYPLLLNNGTYSPDDVLVLSTIFTDQIDAGNFALDLSTLSPGYYRIFYLMSDETLLWDNLYLDPAANDLGALIDRVNDDF